MEKRTILVQSDLAPDFEMILAVPDGVEPDSYIDKVLHDLLSCAVKRTATWDFVDGIS